jgi:type II secretory pathway pseudopilin PulG
MPEMKLALEPFSERPTSALTRGATFASKEAASGNGDQCRFIRLLLVTSPHESLLNTPLRFFLTRSRVKRLSAFTLVEVVTAIAVIGIIFGGVLAGYIQTSRRAEWSGYSLSAQALAIQQLEQARSAVWDNSLAKNELTNLNLAGWSQQIVNGLPVVKGYSWGVLDLPYNNGTNNAVLATNFVTIRRTYLNNVTNPPVQIQVIQVDTVWPFQGFGGRRLYTNRTVNYFAPDNRDATTL